MSSGPEARGGSSLGLVEKAPRRRKCDVEFRKMLSTRSFAHRLRGLTNPGILSARAWLFSHRQRIRFTNPQIGVA